MSKFTENQNIYRKENLNLWKEKLLEFFTDTIPGHYEWNDVMQINKILNIISGKGLNHMLYPDRGGLDMVGCNMSFKRDMIEILTGGSVPSICKPKRLIFDCIDDESEWAYFRLELDRLEASGFYSDENNLVEELYECNGNFEPYSDYPPNEQYRHVLRILNGALLIIPKSCYYNHIPETYFGTHNKYSHNNFKFVMEKLKLSQGYKEFLNELQ